MGTEYIRLTSRQTYRQTNKHSYKQRHTNPPQPPAKTNYPVSVPAAHPQTDGQTNIRITPSLITHRKIQHTKPLSSSSQPPPPRHHQQYYITTTSISTPPSPPSLRVASSFPSRLKVGSGGLQGWQVDEELVVFMTVFTERLSPASVVCIQ